MPNMNQVVLVGHLGRDMEVSWTTTGKSVGKFSIATSIGTKDRPATSWHNVVWWNPPESGLLRKGQAVIVVGNWAQDTYEDKTGKKVTRDYVRAYAVGLALYTSRSEEGKVVSKLKSSAPLTDNQEITDEDVPF